MTQEDKEIIMTSITEDYVSFETAKLLKEKGFNSKCIAYYLVFNENIKFYECNNLGQSLPYISNDNWTIILRNPLESGYTAPTLQMTMKWLRKEHNLCIIPLPVVTDDDGEGGCLWKYTISMKLKVLFDSGNLYESPEVALDDAIKYCLENLI